MLISISFSWFTETNHILKMITSKMHFRVLFLIVFVSLLYKSYAFGAHPIKSGSHQIKCVEGERQALLEFKQELTIASGLSSWGSTEEHQKDCCKWEGVFCDKRTGNVIGLDLHSSYSFDTSFFLRGNISQSLLQLKYLEYLDLSFNSFYGSIPKFLGSFARLKYLNLSYAGFSGTIPRELRNLSSLQTLDLSTISDMYVDNLEWLVPLQSLRNLHLEAVGLSQATDWLKSVSNLPLLQVLDLSGCNLPPVATPSLANSINSSMSLAVLDLSFNNLDFSFFTWLFNYSDSLSEINLSWNSLQGPIPNDFAKMVALTHLDLSNNNLESGVPSYFGNYSSLKSLALLNISFTGHINELMKNLSGQLSTALEYLNLDKNFISGPLPDTIVEFSSLKHLSLRSNRLNGSIPATYGQLTNLEVLDFTDNEISGVVPDFSLSSSLLELYLEKNQLSGTLTESIGRLSNLEKLFLGSNHFEGVISETHLWNLSRLQVLDLSFNSRLEFRFHSHWNPPFQLGILSLRNCMVGPHIPKWIETQKNIYGLDISVAKLSGDIPSWLWNQMSGLQSLNLSYNALSGTLPDLQTKLNGLFVLDLSSNVFEGPIPRLPYNIYVVNLSKNRFSWNITFFCNSSYESLVYLDISDNQLSGLLPDCWDHLYGLTYLNLANNRLYGKFPPSMGLLRAIKTLQLRNNSFTGELPASWKYFDQLNFIDLGHNRLSGTIPPWGGSYLSNVVILDLSSNNFTGKIPKKICSLSKIQVLNLSGNKITGAIPKCIGNFTAMTQQGSSVPFDGVIGGTLFVIEETNGEIYYSPEAFLMWKGRELTYKSTLGLVIMIDLSSNNLTGVIPLEITGLVGLVGLNLSRNHLTGTLVPQIGKLQSLDTLDLSRNHLYGEIPLSLSQLSRLGKLDLSYNNFTGRIPPNTHEASAFAGNPGLCGQPLTQACPGDVVPKSPRGSEVPDEEDQDDKLITKGFYISLALGFIFGFWGVCGVLFFNRSCRHSFFRVLEEMGDWLYVMTTLKLARLQRWLRG